MHNEMKITICGSMTFAKQMKEVKVKLEQLGHVVTLPCDVETHVEDAALIDDLEADAKHLRENDVLRRCFRLVEESEAVLVLNYDKNGVRGYVGTSSLMEMGLAYHLNKELFLWQEVPHSKHYRWAHEVGVMEPAVLNQDLTKIPL